MEERQTLSGGGREGDARLRQQASGASRRGDRDGPAAGLLASRSTKSGKAPGKPHRALGGKDKAWKTRESQVAPWLGNIKPRAPSCRQEPRPEPLPAPGFTAY